VTVVEPIELPCVRPEKLLESEVRGNADFDCRLNSKLSNAKSRVISSRSLSSSSASKSISSDFEPY